LGKGRAFWPNGARGAGQNLPGCGESCRVAPGKIIPFPLNAKRRAGGVAESGRVEPKAFRQTERRGRRMAWRTWNPGGAEVRAVPIKNHADSGGWRWNQRSRPAASGR